VEKMFVLNITEELRLKQLEANEAPELFTLIQSCRSYLRQWLPRIDMFQTVQDVQYFIEGAKAQASAGMGIQAGIWFRGELAGVISFEQIDWTNQSASIGAWLGERFQHNGIVTRATQALIDYSFRGFRLNRVEIRCGTGNLKSRKIPEKLGFQKEGTVREVERLHDRFIDHVIYGMTKSDYQQLMASPFSDQRFTNRPIYY
jgi:ribosomal-protein-serine acetyltransferase